MVWFNKTTQIENALVSLPLFVQSILTAIYKDGHDVCIGGSFARIAILSTLPFAPASYYPPNDIDIFTNCPKERLKELFPSFFQSANFPSYFRYRVAKELPIDLTCVPHSSIEELIAQLDITLNTFFIDHHGFLHAPRKNVGELLEPSIELIDPSLTRLVLDPSRIFRLVRYSTQLKLPLNESIQSLLQVAAPHISKLNLGQFEASILKTLCRVHDFFGHDNLLLMSQLNLIGYLFCDTGRYPLSGDYSLLASNYHRFWFTELNQIRTYALDASSWYVVAMLALPYINSPQLPGSPLLAASERIQQFVSHFLSRFQTEQDRKKVASLHTQLSNKLSIVHSRWMIFQSHQLHAQILQTEQELSSLVESLDLCTSATSQTLLFQQTAQPKGPASSSSTSPKGALLALSDYPLDVMHEMKP